MDAAPRRLPRATRYAGRHRLYRSDREGDSWRATTDRVMSLARTLVCCAGRWGRIIGSRCGPPPWRARGGRDRMSDNGQAHTTLAAFVVDDGDAARRLLKAVQRIDEA